VSKTIKYEVSSGSMYIQPSRFDSLEEAEAYYNEEKQCRSFGYIAITKVIEEVVKREWIPEMEDES